MNAILLESSSKTNMKLLTSLAQSLGIKVKKVSTEQLEDHLLASRIEEGMNTETVLRSEIMKTLIK